MNGKEIYMYTLGGLVVLLTYIILILLLFKPVPEVNHDAIMLVVGSVIGFAAAVVTYFFGSSKSSADKTALLTKKDGQ